MRQSRPQKASSRSGEVAEFTRPEGLLRFAAAVGRGGVKAPPYDAKDKRAVPARWRAGHARPQQTAPNGVPTRGAREGGSPPSFPLTGCRGRLRAAYMPPLQSSRYRHRGFGGAWRRTTSAASQQSWPARAVVCPAGANIARSPVSLRSTVAPRSQPRNPRLKSGGRADGVKNGQ